ncbi:MAG TPA: hypothetical protein VNO70_24165 [Blastocatellia bacterium]|nr:hypothetical protein [Blastocatellia bacterium]
MKLITWKVLPVLALGVLLLLSAASPQHGLAQSQDQSKPQSMAQAPAQSQWLSINVVRVKPELLTEYQDFVKNEAIPTLQKGGVKERHAYTTAIFGESFEYVFVTPIENFARYDSPGPIVKALGEEGARAYGAKARRFIVSSHTYAVRLLNDLSYMGKMDGPPKLALVTSVQVAPERSTEFESFIKNDVLPVMKKAEVAGYLVHQTVYGGNINEYVTLVLYNNFADLDKGHPFARVLGQEGARKFTQKMAGVVAHVERSLARYVPELSFPAPAAVKAENK